MAKEIENKLLGHLFADKKKDDKKDDELVFAYNNPVEKPKPAANGEGKPKTVAKREPETKAPPPIKLAKQVKQAKQVKSVTKRTFEIDDTIWPDVEDLASMLGKKQVELINGLLKSAVAANAAKLKIYRDLRK